MSRDLSCEVSAISDVLGHELLAHDVGVHEVWWEANARCSALPMSSRLAVAEQVIRRVLLMPGVHLVTGPDSDTGAEQIARSAAVLRQWTTWVVGRDHPIVWLTGLGDRVCLDAPLRAVRVMDAGWSEQTALDISRAIAGAAGLNVDFEPPDEEWVRLNGPAGFVGMISTRYPLLLGRPEAVRVCMNVDDRVYTLVIRGFVSEELHANAGLLRDTVLPYGLAELDPESFSANDLFVGSV